MIQTSTWLCSLALLGALSASACGSDANAGGAGGSGDSTGGGSSSTEGGSTNGGSAGASTVGGSGAGGAGDCRTYATRVDMRFDGMDVVSTCEFDEDALEYVCEIALDGETLRVTTTWASLGAFIREAQTLGLVTHEQQIVEEPGSSPKVADFFYDADGRLERSEEQRDEGLLVQVYSNYDSEGRPEKGEMTWEDCPNGVPFSIAYDELTNSVETTFEPHDADSCGREARTDSDVYGENGDLLRVEEGGKDPRIIFESTVVESETVCE